MRTGFERRQFRRAELDLPVAIRPLMPEGSAAPSLVGQVKDVSLAGMYCYVTKPAPVASGDTIACSISISADHAKLFPFTRIAGKGRVLRVDARLRHGADALGNQERVGLAVAFAADVTALTALPSRG